MLRVIFFSMISLVVFSASAQVQTQVIGDSVFIHGNTGKGELILQNNTDSVKGFLFNKGNGRTEFRKGLIRIDDYTFLVGADTLYLNNGLAATENVYYVSRKFSGTGRAVVSGNSLASITSTNTGYNSQLSKATPGSMIFSYPDPFSARNAALDAIMAGIIPNAQIVVLQGNSYTIGSDDSTKNGSIDGQNPDNGTVADIQFSSSTLNTDPSVASIMKNKINMYFSEGTALTYINSSYPVYCCYQSDANNAAFRSGIYGLGSFYQVYGEVNGFSATFSWMDNRSAIVDFHAQELVLQQYDCFVFAEYATYNIEIKNLFTTDANVFYIGKKRTGAVKNGSYSNSARQLNIKVNNCRFGKGQTPYPDGNNYWYLIYIGSNTAIEGTTVTMDFGNLYMKCMEDGALFYINSHSLLYGLHLTVNISNLVQRGSHVATAQSGAGLMTCYSPDTAIDNTITYNIESGNIEAPLLGFFSFSYLPTDAANTNNQLNINAGNLQKISSPSQGSLFQITSVGALNYGEPIKINVNGHFKSHDSTSVIEAYNKSWSLPFPCKYQFSGTYETVANVPVVHFYTNTGKIVSFTDATLINSGDAPSMLADSVCTGVRGMCQEPPGTPISITLYIKNVHATTAPGANIQQYGDTIKVVPDIVDFL